MYVPSTGSDFPLFTAKTRSCVTVEQTLPNPSQSAPGWFGLRCLVSRLTHGCQFEAAPNSYTGSGPRLFPIDDGDHVSDRVPETSPCHVLAGQVGELDPEGDVSSKATSAASRAAQGVGVLPRFASAQLDVGSARGQPRKIQQVRSRSLKENPRSAAWRPIQNPMGSGL